MLPGICGNDASGLSLGTVSIVDETVIDTQIFPLAAVAPYELQSNGNFWLTGSANGAAYDCRATITAGTLSGGSPTGSWINLGTSREWQVTRSGVGTKECTFTLEIGLAGAAAALDTATIMLKATVESGA